MRKRSIRFSHKNRTCWFGTPRRGGGARATRCCVLTHGAWGTTGRVELLPQAYDRPALRREDRTAYMRRDECESSPVGVYQWFLF